MPLGFPTHCGNQNCPHQCERLPPRGSWAPTLKPSALGRGSGRHRNVNRPSPAPGAKTWCGKNIAPLEVLFWYQMPQIQLQVACFLLTHKKRPCCPWNFKVWKERLSWIQESPNATWSRLSARLPLGGHHIQATSEAEERVVPNSGTELGLTGWDRPDVSHGFFPDSITVACGWRVLTLCLG